MIQILLVIVWFSLSNGFLLNNGAVSSGSNMSDKHYVYVMDQLAQDRQIRKTMQGFIVQLQQEMKSTKQELMNLKQGNGYLQNLEISQLKTVSMSLKQTVAKLQNGHDSLKQELDQVKSENKVLISNNKQLYTRLQNEISACNFKTLKISDDLDKFKHSTADQLKNLAELKTNVSSLNQKTDTMNVKINSLTSSSKACGQDIRVLLNKATTNEKEIVALVTENKRIYSELNHLSYNQNNTIQKIDQAFHRIPDNNQTVMLTSCSSGETISRGTIAKFTDTKTVHGISNINGFRTSGQFVCEVAGVYLFSVHIMSDSNDASYQMVKNNIALAYVYVIYTSDAGLHHNTGTGVIAVQLNVGNTLYVKAYVDNMHIYYTYSCITIIKIQ